MYKLYNIYYFIASDTINQTFNDILNMSNDLLKSIETSYILINEYNNIYIIKIDVKINLQEEIKLYKSSHQ